MQRQKVYRPQFHSQFSLENCIILQNRLPMAYVPKHFTYYFINSKRRFFLYLKTKDQLQQLIKIFEKEKVKFYQRKSIFPDRQQNQEIVFHCNYKYKKKDLRWTLKNDSKLKEPRTRFDQKNNITIKQLVKENNYELFDPTQQQVAQINQKIQSKKSLESGSKEAELIQAEQTQPEYVADFGEIKIKSQAVLDIINNVELVKALFKAEKRK